MDFLLSIDRVGFQFFNNLVSFDRSDFIYIFYAEFIVFVLFLAVPLFFVTKDSSERKKVKHMAVVSYGSAFLGAFVFTPIIRLLFFRERPFMEQAVNLLISHDPVASFPSRHTVFMFALSFAVFRHDKIWGSIFLFFSLLSGISRVIVGIHYPSDIIGGIILGYISFLIAKMVITKIRIAW